MPVAMRITYPLLGAVLATIVVQIVLRVGGETSLSPWMRQFLLLMAIVVAVTAAALLIKRWRNYIIPVVAFFVCIASVPFGDELDIRLTLLFYLGIVATTSGSIAMVSGVMAFHTVWIVGMMHVITPFTDAPAQTGIATVFVLSVWSAIIAVFAGREINNSRRREELERQAKDLEGSVNELSEANIGYSDYAKLARHQALLEERNRITREIHDDIGYTLTNITMLSEAAISGLSSEEEKTRETVEAIRHQAQTGLYETRRVLRLLRAAEKGLPRGIDALSELLRIYERATGVSVEFELLARRKRVEDATVFLTIYHFVQECLTNAFRHGQASRVSIRFLEDCDWLFVTVRDNGIGAVTVEEGIGIQGMKERVSAIGGEVRYAQGDGFVITAKVPLVSAPDSGDACP